MLPSLHPPTDSLYKFFAFFGLALVLAPAYLIGQAIGAGEAALLHQVETQARVDATMRSVKDVVAAAKERPSSDAERKAREALALAEKAVEDNEAAIRVSQIHADFLRVKTDKLVDVCVFGIAVSLVGFALWYLRHQRHADELVALQVKELRQKIKEGAPPAAPTATPEDPAS